MSYNQAIFSDAYCTGWIRQDAPRTGPVIKQERASHIWELDAKDKPIVALCGEELPEDGHPNVVVQSDGVALDLLDCAECRLEWPSLHLSHLEDRLEDYIACQKGNKKAKQKATQKAALP